MIDAAMIDPAEPTERPAPAPHEEPMPSGAQRLAIPAIASAAAAVLHAAAAGIHADHPALSRLFIALAVAQGAVAIAAFVRHDRLAGLALVGVNVVAVAGWISTRLFGIAWIDGLEVAERPQLADTIAAVLAAVAVAASVAAWSPRARPIPARAIANAAILAGVLTVPALVDTTGHDHAGTDDHAHDAATAANDGAVVADDGHAHATDATSDASTSAGSGVSSGGDIDGALGQLLGDEPVADDEHTHDQDATSTAATLRAATSTAATSWPRAWDPAQPIDFSGVPGVSAEQQARAEQLAADALRDLPAFADVTAIGALGYRSIGDASTGFEHYVNYSLLGDDLFLDPTAPESLVFRVDGAERTLVSAMFIAGDTPIDDPLLVDFGGPLMQWHIHDNLCWGLDADGQPKVVDVLETPSDTCPPLTVNAGAENPMVHVWITPHACGPFAALEGHGAGQTAAAAGDRVDQCAHDHPTGAANDTVANDTAGTVASGTPYDPTAPIDLGGTAGVTAEQQAFAENLVAATIRDLPQWSDLEAVEAAGFRSIGDAATGHEHYINWDWIDDDVWLDPDHPESLVFVPGPNGAKRLVSAMYMMPTTFTLDDVPDFGGALMQWHIHGDLCFTDDPDTPRVATTKPIGGTCRAPLVDATPAPMIHVWITPNECGPFAALEGIGGGQVREGEAVACDHAHGSA